MLCVFFWFQKVLGRGCGIFAKIALEDRYHGIYIKPGLVHAAGTDKQAANEKFYSKQELSIALNVKSTFAANGGSSNSYFQWYSDNWRRFRNLFLILRVTLYQYHITGRVIGNHSYETLQWLLRTRFTKTSFRIKAMMLAKRLSPFFVGADGCSIKNRVKTLCLVADTCNHVTYGSAM